MLQVVHERSQFLSTGIVCKVSGRFSLWPLEGGGGVGGRLAQPSQRHHVLETGNPGALRRICVSCLSNASSSEAMFLLKPLKELRAKRKGTHLCLSACVCVRFCTAVFQSDSFSFSGSRRPKGRAHHFFPRRISGAVCLLCPIWLFKCLCLCVSPSYFPAVFSRSIGTNP